MRIVLDTNIFVSGIFWEKGPSGQIIDLWKQKEFTLVTSLNIIEELVKTLRNFKIDMPNKIIKEWEERIAQSSLITHPLTKLNIVKDDPDDNKFIEAAIEGKANFIVSQDKHLLKIKEYKNIKIIKPEKFLLKLSQKQNND